MPFSKHRHTGAPRARLGRLALAAAIAAVAAAAPASAEVAIEAVDRTAFRVCADPNNPPYSGEDVPGFENKIAEMFAEKLGRPLVYKWAPKGPGFFPTTLNAKVCDIVMGVPAGITPVLNTNPYYRMTYVMAYRKDSGLTSESLADPALKDRRIGVIAGTPPNYSIVENDLLGNIKPYHQLNDPRGGPTEAEKMMSDLKSGQIDVAVLAGPQAYYWAKEKDIDAVILRLEDAKRKGGKMDYLITMGVRLGERDWKHEINDLIRKNQAEIDEIIQSFGIPVLELVGPPVPKGSKPAASAKPARAGIPLEPGPVNTETAIPLEPGPVNTEPDSQ